MSMVAVSSNGRQADGRIAWRKCSAKTSPRARSNASPASFACRAWPVCRPPVARGPIDSFFMSMAASCATSCSRMRSSRPMPMCCTATDIRPGACFSGSIRARSMPMCIRPRSRCGFAMHARFTPSCFMQCARHCGSERARPVFRRRPMTLLRAWPWATPSPGHRRWRRSRDGSRHCHWRHRRAGGAPRTDRAMAIRTGPTGLAREADREAVQQAARSATQPGAPAPALVPTSQCHR